MKFKTLRALSFATLTSIILLACQTTTEKSPRPSEAQAFVEGLGLGYNLGNTLDATGGTRGNKIANFEVAWGAPITTKAIFEDLKSRGFDTVRIPVAWSNLMAEDYTIHPDLMNRVEEIVRMVLDSGMYAIVNIHWDGGWIGNFPTDFAGSMKKYQRIWTQVCERFQNFDQRLVFESLNEEGSFNDVWNRYGDGNASPKKAKAFDILNDINQSFVDLVRASGGNNATRYLLIAGYATDIDLTCSPEFRMPKDAVRHSIVSVHYYTPSTFTILEKDADWGKSARAWGTDQEIIQLKADMYKMKVNFIDKGIPVILGEFGTVTNNKDPESVRSYLSQVARAAWGVGMCPILWGVPDQHYDRRTLRFIDSKLGDMFLSLSRTPRTKLAINSDPAVDIIPVAAVEPAPATAPAVEPAKPSEIILGEPVSGASANNLAATIGPVTVIVDKDTSFTSNDPIKGATLQMVEFLGKKAVKVTKNSRNEIRLAFVLDKPAKLGTFQTLEFSIAGFDGSEGSYNIGLLWNTARDTGERLGSFYIGRISSQQWIAIQANLSFDEQWGTNFSPDKEVYSIQFWTNQAKAIYITDLAIK